MHVSNQLRSGRLTGLVTSDEEIDIQLGAMWLRGDLQQAFGRRLRKQASEIRRLKATKRWDQAPFVSSRHSLFIGQSLSVVHKIFILSLQQSR